MFYKINDFSANMAVLSTDVHAQTTDFHRWIITTMLTMRE